MTLYLKQCNYTWDAAQGKTTTGRIEWISVGFLFFLKASVELLRNQREAGSLKCSVFHVYSWYVSYFKQFCIISAFGQWISTFSLQWWLLQAAGETGMYCEDSRGDMSPLYVPRKRRSAQSQSKGGLSCSGNTKPSLIMPLFYLT